jgi:acetoin utilization protein AcuB
MIASFLIDPMLPALKISYQVEEVLEWMEESEITQLPVVEDDRYLGLVSVEEMQGADASGVPLAQLPVSHSLDFVYDDQHILELIGLAVSKELKVIPVLSRTGSYLGAVSFSELLEKYAGSIEAGERGAIIVLQVKPQDYSLSEISRLVESEGVKIMMSHYSGAHSYHVDTGISDANYLTLKLNKVNVTSVLATFERFGYQISGVHASEPVTSFDQERLDMLMRYLAT